MAYIYIYIYIFFLSLQMVLYVLRKQNEYISIVGRFMNSAVSKEENNIRGHVCA